MLESPSHLPQSPSRPLSFEECLNLLATWRKRKTPLHFLLSTSSCFSQGYGILDFVGPELFRVLTPEGRGQLYGAFRPSFRFRFHEALHEATDEHSYVPETLVIFLGGQEREGEDHINIYPII